MPGKMTDSNTLGLSVYKGVAKFASPLKEHQGQRAVSLGEEDSTRIQERQGHTDKLRNDGKLIWLHSANLGQSFVLMGLIDRLQRNYPKAHFLLTTTERISEQVLSVRLPKNTLHQYTPYDTPQACKTFLDHWQPDLCLWSENKLMPVLLEATAERAIPMLYLNAAQPGRSFAPIRWVPGVARSVLSRFASILVIDDVASSSIIKLGVKPERVFVTGVLKEGSSPLSVNESARLQIAKQVRGRPVWLASFVSASEESMVIEAHKIAQRSTHRLLTILSPLSCNQIGPLSENLSKTGLNVARRSDPDSFTPLTDILLADVPGELGLWYRIASVSLVGNSMTESGGGMNPGGPAALGSAIIHGPFVENFADRFFRLAQVGAAVEVLSVESLAEAVSELMSPDKAAEMAHAAWIANSEGAEVTDLVLELVAEHLGVAGDVE